MNQIPRRGFIARSLFAVAALFGVKAAANEPEPESFMLPNIPETSIPIEHIHFDPNGYAPGIPDEPVGGDWNRGKSGLQTITPQNDGYYLAKFGDGDETQFPTCVKVEPFPDGGNDGFRISFSTPDGNSRSLAPVLWGCSQASLHNALRSVLCIYGYKLLRIVQFGSNGIETGWREVWESLPPPIPGNPTSGYFRNESAPYLDKNGDTEWLVRDGHYGPAGQEIIDKEYSLGHSGPPFGSAEAREV